MKRIATSFLLFCFFLACTLVNKVYAQPPLLPPANVTSAEDWDQMRYQLNITLPTLSLKKFDPNRDPTSTPRTADEEGDYLDIYGFQLIELLSLAQKMMK